MTAEMARPGRRTCRRLAVVLFGNNGRSGIIDDVAAPSESAAAPLIRAARLEDLPALLRLAREFYDEDGFATSDVELDRNFRALFADVTSAHICLALHDGYSIGFALTTTRVILESGVVAELQDLYVMQAHRRRGVASCLVDDAIRWAKAQQASLLEVVIAPNGRDVSHLFAHYARHGFQDEGRRLLGLDLNDAPT